MSTVKINLYELLERLPLNWRDGRINQVLQKKGLFLTKSHYYSVIPSGEDIANSFEYKEEFPYLETLEGLIDNKLARKTLEELIKCAEPFNPLRRPDPSDIQQYFWENGSYERCDAMSLYAFVRKLKPKKILEIGSGMSSLVSLKALEDNQTGSLTCVEPYPGKRIRALHSLGRMDLHAMKAQDITPEFLDAELDDGDILFIDSTHVVKTGSDCVHVYLRLLPQITKKIYVHIHDIFLPKGYPIAWLNQEHNFWNEQYLLLAWLMDNARTKVLYCSGYNEIRNTDLMEALSHGRYEGMNGGAVWIEYN